MIKIWFEQHGEFVNFAIQGGAGEPIIDLGRVGKEGALRFLHREKKKLIKQIPEAFDIMINNIKQGVLDEEETEPTE